MMRDLIQRFGIASTLATVIAVLAVGAALGAALSSDGAPRDRDEGEAAEREGGNDGDSSAVNTPAARVTQTAERVITERGKPGPRGKRGKRGRPGPVGPAGSSAERVLTLSVDWDGVANASPDSDSVTLPGIGTLTLACPAAEATNFATGPRRLSLSYGAAADQRTVANLTILQQGSDFPDSVENQRYETTGAPIELQLPNNGMIVGTFSAETVSGNGAAAGTLPTGQINLSSVWKTNDPDPAANYCHLSGQVLTTGAP